MEDVKQKLYPTQPATPEVPPQNLPSSPTTAHPLPQLLSRKFALLVLLFIFLLFTIIGIFTFSSNLLTPQTIEQQTSNPTIPIANPVLNPTSGWKAHTDNQLFVKFQYPSSMKITHGSSNSVRIGTEAYPATIVGRMLEGNIDDFIEKNRTTDVTSIARTEIDHPSYTVEKASYIYKNDNKRTKDRLIVVISDESKKFYFITDDKKAQQVLLNLVPSFEFVEAPKISYTFPVSTDFLAKVKATYPKEVNWDKTTKHERNFLWYDNDYNRYQINLDTYHATGSAHFLNGDNCSDCNTEVFLDEYGWEHGKFAADGPMGGIMQYVLRSASGKTLQLVEIERFLKGMPSESGSKCPCDYTYSIYLSEPFTPTF